MSGVRVLRGHGAIALAAMLGLGLGSGCEEVTRRMDFERMIDTARLDAYEPVPWPEVDERAIRRPVSGTVPREGEIGVVSHTLAEIPVPIDMALLQRGRERFERVCSACHGMLGYGNPGVAPHMTLRPPPSLYEPHIRAQSPGRLYATVTEGYGLMPGYARWLDERDRWAVVAHLQVLWISQTTAVADLPPQWADQARMELEP